LFWPFTVWINCFSDLKHCANSRPSASNFKTFSRSLEQFFLSEGQNNFGNKIPLLNSNRNLMNTEKILSQTKMSSFQPVTSQPFYLSAHPADPHWFTTESITHILREVTIGATGATADAPKFSNTLTLFQPGRQILPLHRRSRTKKLPGITSLKIHKEVNSFFKGSLGYFVTF
jgi:hypothetical protein